MGIRAGESKMEIIWNRFRIETTDTGGREKSQPRNYEPLTEGKRSKR